MNKIEQSDNDSNTDLSAEESTDQAPDRQKRTLLLPIILFIIVIAIVAAAAFQGWTLFIQNKLQVQTTLQQLQAELAQRPTQPQIDKSIGSIRQSVNQTDSRLTGLEQGQQSLTNATEKLYELYGRDENGWKLAEVEYLMSIAQHKLILENDFEGAAKTLNAASEQIAELADPGLLQVRVIINEEIALLKTRTRADLVGMTLLLARLTRQVSSLQPGYQTQTEPLDSTTKPVPVATPAQPLQQKVVDFVSSLVTIKSNQPKQKESNTTVIIDVSEKLEDNLKLTRWSLLERDGHQYTLLMNQNVTLFKEYYDLKKAPNADFYEALLTLQKSHIKPELPDISGSLRLLQNIIKKRENEPQQEINNG